MTIRAYANPSGYGSSFKGGNFGIGTSTPGAVLHVKGDAADFNKGIRVEDHDSTDHANIVFDDDGLKFRNEQDGDNFYFRENGNSNILILYDSGLNATLGGTLTESSDERLKTKVETITSALSKVTQMRGVSYESLIKKGNTGNRVGLIAQELEAIAPELVHTGSDKDVTYLHDDTEVTSVKSISYGNLVAYLIEAVKELSTKNTALEARIAALE